MIYVILGIVAVLWILLKLWSSAYSYWESRGFIAAEGTFPFGSNPCVSVPSQYLGLEIQKFYRQFAGHKCVGIYAVRRPMLVVRDPELIKYIMVKDFSHFRDRTGDVEVRNNPLTQHLFSVEGSRWRALRVKLTPTFTSGKLKLMFNLLEVCAERLERKLQEEVGITSGTVDIKDIMSRFTTDIIGSCAFGLDVDSMNNTDEPFRKLGKRIVAPVSTKNRVLEFLYSAYPQLRKVLGTSRMTKETQDLFIGGIAKTIEYRDKNNVRRNDFLDLLMDLRDRGHPDLQPTATPTGDGESKSDDLITLDMDLGLIAAQCFVFFIAGFETSSSVQSFALYEMALNQSIQDKVRNEIERNTKKYGDISYQSLHDMPYLDQVINETIRKYPSLHTLTRRCTKPYQIPGTDLTIDEGIRVLIPIYSLHHDPEYFPDPEKFDPERFNNETEITPFSFMPFGEGPRNCIGMRFGLLQTKMGLVTILKKFRILPTPSTPSQLKFLNSLRVIVSLDGPILLKVENI